MHVDMFVRQRYDILRTSHNTQSAAFAAVCVYYNCSFDFAHVFFQIKLKGNRWGLSENPSPDALRLKLLYKILFLLYTFTKPHILEIRR